MSNKLPELLGALSVIGVIYFAWLAIKAAESDAAWIVMAIIIVFAVPIFVSLAKEPREAPEL